MSSKLVLTDVILQDRMLKQGFARSYVDYMIARIKKDREKYLEEHLNVITKENIIKMHTEGI